MTPGVLSAALKGRLGEFVLDAVFEAPLKGVTGLVGPSGSGKTTVLRCIAGLERLGGALIVDGETWQDERAFVPPHKRRVGYVFQEASLFSHLSVRDNLFYAAKRSEAGTMTMASVVEFLGLEALLKRATGRLSGGERQRVAIGRALLTQPRLLLMDEPLTGLDRAAKAEILPYLERLAADHIVPILYVSHDDGEVARLADRTIHFEAGRVARN